MIKLSIIVPVYNVEQYIRPCFESIFNQGLNDDEYEVIIVNDGSTDKSMEMIEDIISQHNNITIINQDNQGLSVARNNGIAIAKGEYILMPDSDDLLIYNSLPKLLEVAINSRADLIVADFLITNDEITNQSKELYLQQKTFKYEEKNGEQLFLEDLNPHQCYVWRTLFRKEFLIENHLRFVPGIYIQDVPFTHECYIKAKKCIKTSWLLYIYRKGHESATFCFNLRKEKDFCTAIAKTWELTNIQGLSSAVQKKLRDDVYTSFSVMMCSCSHAIKIASERKEIIDHLIQMAPNLYFRNGIKQKIVSLLFQIMPHTYIHTRYYYGQIVEDIILPFYYHHIKKRSS